MVGEIITWKLDLKALVLYKHRRPETILDYRFVVKGGYLLYFEDENDRYILENEKIIRW